MNVISPELVAFLLSNGIRMEQNVPLSKHSYFKTGGIAKLIAFPRHSSELSGIIRVAHQLELKYKVIGATSNIMFLDNQNYSFLICTTELSEIYFDSEKQCIICDAGVMLGDLSRHALLHAIQGFEGLEGIPGTVGAGVVMNAGAYGCEVEDVLASIMIVSENGVIEELQASDLAFGYRTSVLKTGEVSGVVSKCIFKAVKGDAAKIYRKMELFHSKRHKYQEFMYPNLGSIYSGSIYRALGKKDKIYQIITAIYFLLFYKLKILKGQSPINRRWLNEFTVKRFNIRYTEQPFSDKTMNTLTNRGQGTDSIRDYLRQLNRLVGDAVPIENEIVVGF